MSFENQKPTVVEAEVAATENILKEELSVVELEERLEMTAATDDVIIDVC